MTTILLLLIIAFLLLLAKQYYFRGGTAIQRIELIGGEASKPLVAGDELFTERFALLTGTSLSDSNRIELLVNGDALFPRMWRDLRSAERLITFQAFRMSESRVAEELCDILTERARAGVRIHVLTDYIGGWSFRRRYIGRLREAGVHVAVYRPLRWGTLYKFQQRTHMRSVVVDGRVGYTGGFGIDDRWAGDGRHADQWRDTYVRVEGQITDQLEAAFMTNWAEATGDMLFGDDLLAVHEQVPANVDAAGIMYAAPDLDSTTAGRAFFISIGGARERLYITNPYFIPDRNLRALLRDTAARGVDVRVLTPGANNNRKSAWYAGRAHYEELLEAGVRIYEYDPTMVHAKTMVVDGVWSLVGTINFDTRSMALNEEISLVVRDEDFGARMEEVFRDDLARASELDIKTLRRRPWTDRALERASLLVAPVL